MPVRAERLQRDLETIAGVMHAGSNRPTFSPAWAAAVEYVVGEAKRCGCGVRVDAFGNVHLRPEGLPAKTPVWMSGSHLDSVPNGGDFDGVLGVVAPLEVLRAAHEDGLPPPALEAVVFAEEEGTTFGLGMLGSRSWLGTLSAAELAPLPNAAGENFLLAGRPFGVEPDRFERERLSAADYLGLIEVHIEQGPAMWKHQQPVALVTAINGRRQYFVRVRGVANHAGSTGMADRNDALAGAAEMILAVEQIPKLISVQAVGTVGRIECRPNALNVIPDHVSFTIDFRAPWEEQLEAGDEAIRRKTREIAAHRGLQLEIEETEYLPAVALSAEVCGRLRTAAKSLSIALPETVSGALHDAAILAPVLPTAMLFVASKDGISHNPDEYSRLEDITLATQILYQVVTGA